MSQALPAFETVAAFATPILIADLPEGRRPLFGLFTLRRQPGACF